MINKNNIESTMKHLLLPLAILLSANTLLAQENLPPVLKADSANFRKDILTRTYKIGRTHV